VSEVIDPTFERLSLNGWFHSDREISLLDYADPRPPVQQQVPNEVREFEDFNHLTKSN
ncbi:unnamed protein product, partial [Nesidiocoris tenuis]